MKKPSRRVFVGALLLAALPAVAPAVPIDGLYTFTGRVAHTESCLTPPYDGGGAPACTFDAELHGFGLGDLVSHTFEATFGAQAFARWTFHVGSPLEFTLDDASSGPFVFDRFLARFVSGDSFPHISFRSDAYLFQESFVGDNTSQLGVFDVQGSMQDSRVNYAIAYQEDESVTILGRETSSGPFEFWRPGQDLFSYMQYGYYDTGTRVSYREIVLSRGEITDAPGVVPEPASLWMTGGGLLGLVALARRRNA